MILCILTFVLGLVVGMPLGVHAYKLGRRDIERRFPL